MLKSRLQMKFLSAGHSSAVLRAMSYHSPAARFKDMTNGIEYYETVSRIADHFDEEKGRLVSILTELCKKIFRKERMIVSYTGAKESFDAVLAGIAAFSGRLWKEKVKEGGFLLTCTKKNEGFQTASKVQYVAMAGNFIDAGMEYHGALQILKVIMGYEYLWQNIRVKGGAYGCMNSYMRNGDTYFVSYRDPNLKKTDEIYDGIPQYLADFKADEREMTKYIIGTISDMDTPMNPSAKGARSMTAYLQGLDFADIQKERDQVIGATDEDIRGLKDLIMQLKNLYE